MPYSHVASMRKARYTTPQPAILPGHPPAIPKLQSRLCPWPGEATERLNGKVEEHTGTDRDRGEEEKMSQGVRGLPLRLGLCGKAALGDPFDF